MQTDQNAIMESIERLFFALLFRSWYFRTADSSARYGLSEHVNRIKSIFSSIFGVRLRVINEYYFKIIFKQFDRVRSNLRFPIERGHFHPITNYNDAPHACHLFYILFAHFFFNLQFRVAFNIQLSIKNRNSDKTNSSTKTRILRRNYLSMGIFANAQPRRLNWRCVPHKHVLCMA